jgi:hypothetical protein
MDVGIRKLYYVRATRQNEQGTHQYNIPHTVEKPKRMLYFSTTEFDPAKKLMRRFGCDGMQFNPEIKLNL